VDTRDLRRFAAPAAFLVAATVAVADNAASTRALPPITHRRVAVTTTTTKKTAQKHHAATAQYWTVQAGDTFGVISAKTGVPVATIEQLNPNVSSTALTIGEKIRIK
jgi:LysM repeat protein